MALPTLVKVRLELFCPAIASAFAYHWLVVGKALTTPTVNVTEPPTKADCDWGWVEMIGTELLEEVPNKPTVKWFNTCAAVKALL